VRTARRSPASPPSRTWLTRSVRHVARRCPGRSRSSATARERSSPSRWRAGSPGEQGRGPAHLFVSGRPAPPRHRHHNLRRAGDPALIAELASLGGTDPRILRDSEVLELIVRVMRGDYTASETYRFAAGPPLSCDLTAMTGDRDWLTTIEEAAAWSAQTTGAFHLRVYPGGHFSLDDCRAQVLEVIWSSLAGNAASPR
jgi:pyochelin biosynthetic protein PchC